MVPIYVSRKNKTCTRPSSGLWDRYACTDRVEWFDQQHNKTKKHTIGEQREGQRALCLTTKLFAPIAGRSCDHYKKLGSLFTYTHIYIYYMWHVSPGSYKPENCREENAGELREKKARMEEG